MRDFKNMPNDFKRIADRFESLGIAKLTTVVKVEALNHFEKSWDNQGFTDESLQKWRARKAPARQKNNDGSRSKSFTRWQQKNEGRAILVGHQSDVNGTHLKDSLRAIVNGKSIVFSTDKVYAEVHNEGGKAGRGKGFIMPKRQFIGKSKALNKKVERKFDKEMDKTFKIE